MKEAIGTQIRAGFLLGHYIVSTGKNSLRPKGDNWRVLLVSRCAGVPLNTDVSEISATGDISALGVSVPQCALRVRSGDKSASFVGDQTDTAHP